MLYAQAVRARRRWFERHPERARRLRRPVISVGNLSVGGTGKTPLVAAVARWLLDCGERPAVLSRGYRRRRADAGAVVVADGRAVLADLDTAGDEPLLLARAVPGAVVVVANDRYLAGVIAERRLGATVHLLDDGFQHLQLARDLDVLVTARGEIPSGRVLPFGRLREPASAAARAHIVIVMDADAAAAREEGWTLGVSLACGARRIIPGPDGRGRGAALAVSGIGHPRQFFDGLRDAGWTVAGTLAFGDHHRYTTRDVDRIARAAGAAGAAIVLTTEKDAVRLEPLGPLPFTVVAVPLAIQVDPWELLSDSIEAALSRHADARGQTAGAPERP